MSNSLFNLYRQACVEGSGHASYVAWLADNIKLSFVTSSYVPNFNTDQFYNPAISTAGWVVASSGNFASKSHTLGVANAANVTVSSVSGSTINSIVIWKDTGTATTSPLIAYIDTGTGSSVVPLSSNG
jgi:hypothetical protein